MGIIDNNSQTMQSALSNALTNADKVDISVGYFYFSGFEALAEQLKDKHVRVLVGMEVDPTLIGFFLFFYIVCVDVLLWLVAL